MYLSEPQLTAHEVLRAFHQDEPKLFLGAAFATVGVVSAAFCLIRRRADVLLISLAAFAFLYGQRLWLESNILTLTVSSEFFRQLRQAVNPLVPVPAIIFFQAAGLLPQRAKPFTYAAISIFLVLTLLTAILGGQPILRTVNNLLVIIALLAVLIHSIMQRRRDRDYRVLRFGLLVFVAFALWDNSLGPYLNWAEIEAYGLAIFLACMGYVAAGRVLQRDQELAEIRRELDLARRIQLSILPDRFPQSTPFDVAARYVPMAAVAGDLYDFLVAGEGQAGLLIADVSGHGVPAALIASMVKMAATAQRAHAAHPAKLLAEMNAALCGNTLGQFVTAAYVYVDARTRELRYAAAGHPAMLMLRDGQVFEIAENGLLLAVTGEATYSQRSLPLRAGDRLLLYTDGLLEARNAEGHLFGEESLAETLKKTEGLAPADAVQQIIEEVQRWAAAQEDDLTALVCDFVSAT